MPREQLELVDKMRQIQDPKSVEMLAQFVTLVQNGRAGDRSSGLMGLPQFLTFLNKSQEEAGGGAAADSGPSRRASSRISSITSPRIPTGPKISGSTAASTLPRPTRKSSVTTSQTYSMSSRSTTPDTPRKIPGLEQTCPFPSKLKVALSGHSNRSFYSGSMLGFDRGVKVH